MVKVFSSRIVSFGANASPPCSRGSHGTNSRPASVSSRPGSSVSQDLKQDFTFQPRRQNVEKVTKFPSISPKLSDVEPVIEQPEVPLKKKRFTMCLLGDPVPSGAAELSERLKKKRFTTVLISDIAADAKEKRLSVRKRLTIRRSSQISQTSLCSQKYRACLRDSQPCVVSGKSRGSLRSVSSGDQNGQRPSSAGSTSRDSDDSDQDEEAEMNDAVEPPTCGLLMDMIQRKGISGGEDKTKSFLAYMKVGDRKLFEYTKDAILRDEFYAMVWEHILRFYKDADAVTKASSKGQAWETCTTQHVRKAFTQLVRIKREVACFSKETHNWLLSYKLLNANIAHKYESVRERQNRMEEFWAQYQHNVYRNDLPPREKICPITPSKGEKQLSLVPKAEEKLTLNSLATQRNGIDLTTERDVKRDRDNSAKGRRNPQSVSYGMKFLETGKMKWMVVSPGEGTRAALMQSLPPSTVVNPPSMGYSSSAPELKKIERRGNVLKLRDGAGITASTPDLKRKQSVGSKVLPPIRREKSTRNSISKLGGTVLASIHGEYERPSLSDAPSHAYVEACRRCHIAPTPLQFVTGHSLRFQAAGRDMMDSDLLAVTSMITLVSSIEEIDLSDNVLLTENSLVPFFHCLLGEPAASTLQKLILRGMKHMGSRSIDAVTKIVADANGTGRLRMIDMSHVHIASKCHLKLAEAIHKHAHLEAINLSDTCLGSNGWIASRCVELLMAESVTALDISWNCFDPVVFRHLGDCLVKRKTIEALSVSNCSSASLTEVSPAISFFLECLVNDVSLTFLDISLNAMDYRCALILEDTLQDHKTINKVNISENPLGTFGMRSALRLLCSESNNLCHIDSHNCFHGSSLKMFSQSFNMTNPGGRYTLHLDQPYHRTILRMLYKQCERFGCPMEQAFCSIQYSKPPWIHATKTKTSFEVPTEGSLDIVFNIDAFVENRITGISSNDFTGFLDKYASLTKVQPPLKKAIPLFGSWKLIDGKSMDQQVFLNAMAKDFCLTPAHLEHMCNASPMMRSEIVYRLLPCVTGGEASECLCMMLFQTVGEFIRMHQVMRRFIDFNAETPTGHYKLDLGNCTDYAVAEKLLLLDRWEVVLGRRQNRRDTSQRGNFSHIRNEQYKNETLRNVSSLSDWRLPEVDEFEFDYVSGRRCSLDAVVINDATFDGILFSLYHADCSIEAQLEVLRLISHHMYMTAKQMRTLLGSFRAETHRGEIFVTFFLRIVDVWNSKIFRVRFSDEQEVTRLQERLGYAVFFPFIQPENAKFRLDFRFHDQRLCANILMKVAEKEGVHNVHNPEFLHVDGTVDPFPLGVPRSWETFDKMPKEGIFKAYYNCAPENRKFNVRTSLAETYGSFVMSVDESKVMWWTGLQEPPKDVVEWLEFCIGKFKTMSEAFVAIDGEDGNGVISLREFEDGLASLNCKKFHGPNEQKRIEEVFRYMDPSGDGSVSKTEWAILDQLWNEFDLCIYELVAFFTRTWGDDIHAWWNELCHMHERRELDSKSHDPFDAKYEYDENAELTEDDWLKAVESIGYFGPAQCVFELLDNSDDGSISIDEFMVLERYKKADSADSLV